MRVHIGVDFGGNGLAAHAFVATGVAGIYRMHWPAEPQNPSERHGCIVPQNQFIEFVEAVFARWGEVHAVYCDSAEQVLKNSLRSALLRTRFSWLADRIYNSKKIEINDRIRLTSILMGGGRFWYMPEAGTLRDALASAMWSGKHPGHG